MNVINLEYKRIESNYRKGNLGEVSVQDAFKKLGCSVQVHKVSDKGVDILALFNNSVSIGEVLNWSCKGYIHCNRFGSIVDSLHSRIADNRYLFAFGVSPTKAQKRLLHAYAIKLCYFKDGIKKLSKSIIAKIVNAINAVITYNDVCTRNWFTSYIIGVFSCACFKLRFFDWYRRLRKYKFVRNFWFMGGFVSEN